MTENEIVSAANYPCFTISKQNKKAFAALPGNKNKKVYAMSNIKQTLFYISKQNNFCGESYYINKNTSSPTFQLMEFAIGLYKSY